ncbi:MAG TPA: sigma-70 family RNA polymerase sigma factor [Verrucomicrobiae bacterium]|nr:sigma-70 family RNA polymerase sigma factor [Verrucomicrobiae bacterium]
MDPDEFIPTRASLLSRLKDWEDQTSWREFFDTYGRLIYGVARKAGLSDAEAQDVLQETLLAVAKKMPGFTYDPKVDSFKGWLLTVTQWKIADQFRKRSGVREQCLLTSAATRQEGTRPTAIERMTDPAGFDLQAIWDGEWQAHLLRTALDRVKRRAQPAHFEMYYLHVIKEQPARDVARTLGVSVAQVYLAKHRLGSLLKQELKRLKAAG